MKRHLFQIFMLFIVCLLSQCFAREVESIEKLVGAANQETGGGLIVHLGCGDGRLTAELHASDQYLVHGLDPDPANVEAARQYLADQELLGPTHVDLLSGPRLPYADNIVNFMVVDQLGDVPMSEVMRVLTPGGSAIVQQDGVKQRLTKQRPDEMDDWTHWLYDATGNAVGQDRLVGPPRQFQWAAGPLWSRHHNSVPSVSAMVSSGGRVFTIVDEAPPAMDGTTPDKWFLTARDAFNGIELWRLPIDDWGWSAWSAVSDQRFNQPNNVAKRLVAVGDRVYVTLGFNAELTALDAATGEVVQRYEGSQYTDEILYKNGLLILSINKGPQGPGEIADAPSVHKTIAVYDAASGEQLWQAGDFIGNSTKTKSIERETHLLISASDDQIFLLDGDAVVSMDLETGEQLWRSPRPVSPDYTSRYDHRMSEMCTLVATEDAILLCQLEPIQERIGWRVIKARIQAYDPESGEPMWEYKCGNWGHFCVPDVFVAQGLVWVHDEAIMSIVGLDPITGIEQRRLSTEKALDNGHHHRCYRNKATEQFLITSFRGLEYIDWASGDIDRNHWVRGACRYGVMPCNGLIYSTPHPCDCYITSKLNGFHALAPVSLDTDQPVMIEDAVRLHKGPAYESSFDSSPKHPALWPMYRHDAARTGCSGSTPPSDLKIAWTTKLPGGRITAPTAAGGYVYVASIDAGVVHAIGVATGEARWNYIASGRVDTPPTIIDNRILFGCRSGWVYCLRAYDGAEIWKFHAAPRDRLVVGHGGIESAWPVHGSVLVQDGKAYVTAGRSSFLDGGIAAYCLDVVTGEVLEERMIDSMQDMPVDMGRNQNDNTGVLSDLLVSEGDSIFMRNVCVFGPDVSETGWGRRVSATAGMLDDSWFNRAVWTVDGRDYGELLVHDEECVYSVKVHKSRGHGQFIEPGKNAYQIIATERAEVVPRRPDAEPLNFGTWPRAKDVRWELATPMRVTAMLLGGNTLVCAGTPDVLDPEDPWAVYEGRRGGILYALSTEDGEKMSELLLDAAPVYDGMAVACGRLYLSTVDGTLISICE
jgi:outer membrane protein assembly factor BamB